MFDIETSEKVSVFAPNIPNQYTKNRATFCPTDELILSGECGCLCLVLECVIS